MMFTNFRDSIRKLEAAEAKNVPNQEQYRLAFRRERLRSLIVLPRVRLGAPFTDEIRELQERYTEERQLVNRRVIEWW